jgi:hypothetical protein
MPRIITAQHQWVIATTIDVDAQLARKGVQRGTLRLPATTKVDVMETYCAMCRKSYEDVADTPCAAAVIGTEHLRGGPIGERKKRKHPHHDCEAVGCEHAVVGVQVPLPLDATLTG